MYDCPTETAAYIEAPTNLACARFHSADTDTEAWLPVVFGRWAVSHSLAVIGYH
jgi:hypothetical protein